MQKKILIYAEYIYIYMHVALDPCMIRAYVYMMHVIVNDLGIGQEGARHEHGWHAYIYMHGQS